MQLKHFYKIRDRVNKLYVRSNINNIMDLMYEGGMQNLKVVYHYDHTQIYLEQREIIIKFNYMCILTKQFCFTVMCQKDQY